MSYTGDQIFSDYDALNYPLFPDYATEKYMSHLDTTKKFTRAAPAKKPAPVSAPVKSRKINPRKETETFEINGIVVSSEMLIMFFVLVVAYFLLLRYMMSVDSKLSTLIDIVKDTARYSSLGK